jgi:DNA-binding winged helix-turn-helix (wHTH) protein/Tol biopolymer transport system component
MAGKSFVYSFDDVEVREQEFALDKAGKTLTVEPKAFRLLLFLLHNPQRLISKDELLNAVWGDAAVTEGSLTRCIWMLRHVLDDDLKVPRYIETVATVGYRFICPVEVSEDLHGGLVSSDSASARMGGEFAVAPSIPGAAEPAGEKFAAKPPDGGIWIFGRWWLLAAAVLAVGLASAIWYTRRPLPPPRISEYTQITHDSRPKDVVGTDGARLYLDIDSQSQHIAQTAISGGEIRSIPVPLPNAWMKDLSPDGSTLIFNSWEGGQPRGLWSLNVPGGSFRQLVDQKGVIDGTWSPDGKSVVYSTTNGEIDVVQSDGTGDHRLIGVQGQNDNGSCPVWIAWSPDGSTMRFSWKNQFWEMSRDGSGLHPLLPDWHPASWQCYGRWTRDGRFFVFLLQEPLPFFYPTIPAAQLWVLDERRGKFRRERAEPVQLTSGPIRWSVPIPSKDGKKIFARGVILRGELVRYDAQSHQFEPYMAGISAEHVAFSPDGKFVAYVTFPEGILWRANRDGSNPVQLSEPPMYPLNPRWSPDGTKILFYDDRSVSYIISSEGGTPRLLLPQEKEAQSDPNWSPDGRKIVFGSMGSKAIIRILDLPNGQITDIPGSQGRWSPRWSPDGRYIYGLTRSLSGIRKLKTVSHLESTSYTIGYISQVVDSKG